jgi:hypothetical protein
MLNNNDQKFFLQTYQDANGQAQFKKNKTARADKRAEWAWNTITGKATMPAGIGFYPTNIDGESRWGAFDFDAHVGNHEGARQRAAAAFHLLSRQTKHFLLLGTSGGSGWHLFVYADQFYRVEEWIRFLEEVALKIGVEVKPGVCEIFPSSTRGRHGGGAIRAPGSWNPKSGDFGRLHFDQVSPALDAPSSRQSLLLCYREVIVSSLYRYNTREGKQDYTDKRQNAPEIGFPYQITAPATRNSKLKELVGKTYRGYGRDVVRKAAELQHIRATPAPQASLEEHLAEFGEFWDFFCGLWREELSEPERAVFDDLYTQTERDVFRILWGFNKISGEKGRKDFTLSCKNVAERAGLTFDAVAKMRRRFEERGIIRKTAEHIPNVRSALFSWTASPNRGGLFVGFGTRRIGRGAQINLQEV